MTAARDPGLPSQGHAPAPTTAADEFDALFHGEAHRRAFSRACHLADPALPPDVEPFSFLSADLLHHIALALTEDSTLADLGCGRGGPGLWLARTAHARLVGIDFSPVAVAQAQHRATTLGVGDRAQFTVGDLTTTGLPDASVSAAVSIDALQYAHDHTAAAAETRRILRPGGRLVITGWHPRQHGDPRLPDRHRHTHWPTVGVS